MHDIGALIWVLVILIGLVSSIRKNAQRARRAQRDGAPQAVQPPRQAAPGRQQLTMAVPPAPPPSQPATQAPPPPLGRVVVTVPRPPVPLPLHTPARVGTSPIRGMFGGSTTLVRAIVAAEVLGPPKASQEQSIWSPRHSEPSI